MRQKGACLHVHDDLVLRLKERPEALAGGRRQKVKAGGRILVNHQRHAGRLRLQRAGAVVVRVHPAHVMSASAQV